jgi:hypothetical protein
MSELEQYCWLGYFKETTNNLIFWAIDVQVEVDSLVAYTLEKSK